MRQQPKTLRFASLLTLLATLQVATSAHASAIVRQCRRACHDEIAACVAAAGHLRACRKSVLGRCKREGVAVCPCPAASATTTTIPTTASSSTTMSTLPSTNTRITGFHYAPNNNFDSSGNYLPGAVGFNLADVSSVGDLASLPSGVKALVWLGLCDGVDAAFVDAVRPFAGDPRVFGFYLMDEPDPTGQWAPLCTAANLMAEADWIHANVPGAQTFIVMMNFDTSTAPTYADTYRPENSHIDLYGIDPYPCRTETNGCDYSMITKAVAAAESSGIPVDTIVPVYQAFGAGNWDDDGGGQYTLPTANQEQHILSTWAPLVPNPVFDYAYSWGTQNSDQALERSRDLQAVFFAHNVALPVPSTRPRRCRRPRHAAVGHHHSFP